MREKIKTGIGQADYDYMDNMPPDGWEWEFVRRNESYREKYSEIKKNKAQFSGGSPIENPEDAFFYERWWKIEKEFGVNPFYEIREYGAGVPDPDRGYNLLPGSIKPVMKGKDGLFPYGMKPLKALTSLEVERETNRVWDRRLMEVAEFGGKKFVYQRYLQKILSPDNSSNTLYLGVSLRGKRDDVRKEFERLLRKHIRAKSEKGYRRHRIREWESYLMVWDAWVKHGVSRERGFSEIARKLDINLSTVKTRWYQAYFLITGKKYERKDFKNKSQSKADKLCGECIDASCYKGKHEGNWIPCSKYLKIASTGYQREKTVSPGEFEELQKYRIRKALGRKAKLKVEY